MFAVTTFAHQHGTVHRGDKFRGDDPLAVANPRWFADVNTPTDELPNMWNEMPAPPPPVPSPGFNVIVKPNPASLIPRHRQVRSKVSRWLPGKWAPGSLGRKAGCRPSFGTAISVGQIFDVGDAAVRANPQHFGFIARDVELEDIERLTREEVKA